MIASIPIHLHNYILSKYVRIFQEIFITFTHKQIKFFKSNNISIIRLLHFSGTKRQIIKQQQILKQNIFTLTIEIINTFTTKAPNKRPQSFFLANTYTLAFIQSDTYSSAPRILVFSISTEITISECFIERNKVIDL